MAAPAKRLLLLTADEAAAASLERSAREAGWKVERRRSSEGVEEAEGVVVVDDRLPDRNAYEVCRALAASSRARVLVAHRAPDRFAPSIARFCGAAGAIALPSDAESLRLALSQPTAPVVPDEKKRRPRGEGPRDPAFPAAMLRDLSGAGESPTGLVELLSDPETKLFNAPYLLFKLDEEFKRALRFKMPLACVVLGFEGEASADVLLDLASIFLLESRDTDVLGRFDLNRFVFLLPNTGQDGAQRLAERIVEAAAAKGWQDLAGDPLAVSAGLAIAPGTGFEKRDDLLHTAQAAFERARNQGGGVQVAAGPEPSSTGQGPSKSR